MPDAEVNILSNGDIEAHVYAPQHVIPKQTHYETTVNVTANRVAKLRALLKRRGIIPIERQ
jgi:hypothetical protein